MSTTDIASTSTVAADDAGASGGVVGALAEWLTSTDSKVIGRTFAGTAVLVLLATTVLGVLLGVERIDGAGTVFDADALPQLFVAWRVGLVYGVMVPLLLGVAVAIVPLQVGARSLAFPRLAAAGFWAWFGGLVLVMIALVNNGGPGGGDSDMVDLFLAALALTVIGLAAAATSVATTVLTTRAPGMRMGRVPFFSWSALVASIGLLLMLPVLLGVLVYLFVDHRHARAVFGGNEGVASWIGFAFTQPATYLFALPAVGVVAELIPVTFRRRMPMRGAVYTGLGLVGVAALSAVTQQATHELPWSGSGLDVDDFGSKLDDLLPYALFLLLPMLGVVIVMAVGALAGKPVKGGPRPRVTAVFAFGFFGLGMVFVGMVGGALLPITDLGLQGTVFEEGALVYVAYGTVLGALGALTYWAPKWTGRTIGESPALGLAGLGMIATVLASLPYYVAGFADQPAAAGEYDYAGPAELWNVLVTVGHGLMLLVVLAYAGLWVRSLRDADAVAANDPWDGQTLEWLTPSPAPFDNFPDVPAVMSPEPALDRRAAPPGSEGR